MDSSTTSRWQISLENTAVIVLGDPKIRRSIQKPSGFCRLSSAVSTKIKIWNPKKNTGDVPKTLSETFPHFPCVETFNPRKSGTQPTNRPRDGPKSWVLLQQLCFRIHGKPWRKERMADWEITRDVCCTKKVYKNIYHIYIYINPLPCVYIYIYHKIYINWLAVFDHMTHRLTQSCTDWTLQI